MGMGWISGKLRTLPGLTRQGRSDLQTQISKFGQTNSPPSASAGAQVGVGAPGFPFPDVLKTTPSKFLCYSALPPSLQSTNCRTGKIMVIPDPQLREKSVEKCWDPSWDLLGVAVGLILMEKQLEWKQI